MQRTEFIQNRCSYLSHNTHQVQLKKKKVQKYNWDFLSYHLNSLKDTKGTLHKLDKSSIV